MARRTIRPALPLEDPFVALYGQRPFPPEQPVDEALALYLASENVPLGAHVVAQRDAARAGVAGVSLSRRLGSFLRRLVTT